jgi:hypothetical protein
LIAPALTVVRRACSGWPEYPLDWRSRSHPAHELGQIWVYQVGMVFGAETRDRP